MMFEKKFGDYQETVVEEARQSLREMRDAVARLIPHLRWRHHGFGVLQGYLVESREPETRVHIWHPDLQFFEREEGGRIHDHRFSLRSTVLLGEIGHDEVRLTHDPKGAWTQFTVVNARNQGPADLPAPFEGSYSAEIVEGTIPEGHAYTFPKRKFHRSRTTGLAVTLLTKFDQESTQAKLLVPKGWQPKLGIAHETKIDMEKYTDMAVAALLKAPA